MNNKLVNNFHHHEKYVTSNTSTSYKKQQDYYKNAYNQIPTQIYLQPYLQKPQSKMIPFPSYLPNKSRYYLLQTIPYLLQEIKYILTISTTQHHTKNNKYYFGIKYN